MKNKKINQWLITALVILAVVGVGVFAVNQTLGYIYRSQFLQTPCEVCLDLNPNLDLCNRVELIDNNNLLNFELPK